SASKTCQANSAKSTAALTNSTARPKGCTPPTRTTAWQMRRARRRRATRQRCAFVLAFAATADAGCGTRVRVAKAVSPNQHPLGSQGRELPRLVHLGCVVVHLQHL